MEIKAYAIMERGAVAKPFTYARAVGADDVLVRITHRSIATGDVQFIDNAWNDTRYPLVPSHEMVGLVEEVGSNVAELAPGDRVGIGFQLGACFACAYCLRGVEQFCQKQTVVGVNAFGGLAEHIVVDSRFAFRLPAELDSAAAVPLFSSGLTVYSAIKHAQLVDGARVAVLGIGGLGRMALQFLRSLGYQATAVSRSPDKRDVIRKLGADYLDGTDAEALAAQRGTYDFVLSTLNVSFDLETYLTLLKPDGQLCLVASPAEPLSLRAGLLYDYGRRRIFGSYVGSRADVVSMLQHAAQHDIQPFLEVMPFGQLNAAIGRIRNREIQTALVLVSEGS
ncbi:MAG TPA: NAD(P)-dependent alcohol dehydrogenase [Polyangiales bacterium]|nr:NAD(P)-dependent alcohol dehydrogenase [Polyangiales bacterium]